MALKTWRPWARRPGLAAAVILLGTGTAVDSAVAQGQAVEGERPWVVSVSRYGKWASLAAAAGLVTLAAVYQTDATDAEDALAALCIPAPADCQIVGSGGTRRYASVEAEELFLEFARLEKQSRRFLIGGQLALIASAGMFLIDLMHRDGGPANIPFVGLDVHTAPRQLGVRISF